MPLNWSDDYGTNSLNLGGGSLEINASSIQYSSSITTQAISKSYTFNDMDSPNNFDNLKVPITTTNGLTIGYIALFPVYTGYSSQIPLSVYYILHFSPSNAFSFSVSATCSVPTYQGGNPQSYSATITVPTGTASNDLIDKLLGQLQLGTSTATYTFTASMSVSSFSTVYTKTW